MDQIVKILLAALCITALAAGPEASAEPMPQNAVCSDSIANANGDSYRELMVFADRDLPISCYLIHQDGTSDKVIALDTDSNHYYRLCGFAINDVDRFLDDLKKFYPGKSANWVGTHVFIQGLSYGLHGNDYEFLEPGESEDDDTDYRFVINCFGRSPSRLEQIIDSSPKGQPVITTPWPSTTK